MIYLLTAVGLTHGGSSTVHNYIQTKYRTTQNKEYIIHKLQLGFHPVAVVFNTYTRT